MHTNVYIYVYIHMQIEAVLDAPDVICSGPTSPEHGLQDRKRSRYRSSRSERVRSRPCLDLQKVRNNGSYTAYTLYFGILGHHFGHFGGPGKSGVANKPPQAQQGLIGPYWPLIVPIGQGRLTLPRP